MANNGRILDHSIFGHPSEGVAVTHFAVTSCSFWTRIWFWTWIWTGRNPAVGEEDILEVIATFVVPFVFHVEDNAFAVFGIGPCEAVGVVCDAILQHPGFEIAVLEIGVAVVMGREGVFVEAAGVVGTNDDIECVSGALGAVLSGGALVVRDSVPGARCKLAAVSECQQFRIGDQYGEFRGFTAAASSTAGPTLLVQSCVDSIHL